jgi:hypothetical protein
MQDALARTPQAQALVAKKLFLQPACQIQCPGAGESVVFDQPSIEIRNGQGGNQAVRIGTRLAGVFIAAV